VYRVGTPESMYLEYVCYCNSVGEDCVSEDYFHEVRKREHIGVEQGDIFRNPIHVDKETYTRDLEALKKKYHDTELFKQQKSNLRYRS